MKGCGKVFAASERLCSLFLICFCAVSSHAIDMRLDLFTLHTYIQITENEKYPSTQTNTTKNERHVEYGVEAVRRSSAKPRSARKFKMFHCSKPTTPFKQRLEQLLIITKLTTNHIQHKPSEQYAAEHAYIYSVLNENSRSGCWIARQNSTSWVGWRDDGGWSIFSRISCINKHE